MVSVIVYTRFEHETPVKTESSKQESTPRQPETIALVEKKVISKHSPEDSVPKRNQNCTSGYEDKTSFNSRKSLTLTEDEKHKILSKINELQTLWPQLECIEVTTVTGNKRSSSLGSEVVTFLKDENVVSEEIVATQTVYGKSMKGIRVVVSGNCIVVEVKEV